MRRCDPTAFASTSHGIDTFNIVAFVDIIDKTFCYLVSSFFMRE